MPTVDEFKIKQSHLTKLASTAFCEAINVTGMLKAVCAIILSLILSLAFSACTSYCKFRNTFSPVGSALFSLPIRAQITP